MVLNTDYLHKIAHVFAHLYEVGIPPLVKINCGRVGGGGGGLPS